MPKNGKQPEFIQWTFDCNDSAVEEQRQAMDAENRIGMYPEAQFEAGANSWEWAEMPTCSQKMTLSEEFDPQNVYFKKGAHMPLWFFIGVKGQTRRSQEEAAARGWDRDRIEAMKRGQASSNRGSGATSWSGYQGNSSSSATPWHGNVDWSQNFWNQYWRDSRESGWS